MSTQSTTTVEIRPLNVETVRKGNLIALASVEIEIEGIVIVLDGVQIRYMKKGRNKRPALGVFPPKYRDAAGRWLPAVGLPEQINKTLSEVLLQACADKGLIRRRWLTAADFSFIAR